MTNMAFAERKLATVVVDDCNFLHFVRECSRSEKWKLNRLPRPKASGQNAVSYPIGRPRFCVFSWPELRIVTACHNRADDDRFLPKIGNDERHY